MKSILLSRISFWNQSEIKESTTEPDLLHRDSTSSMMETISEIEYSFEVGKVSIQFAVNTEDFENKSA